METEPGEEQIAEEDRRDHPEESGGDGSAEVTGEPERRLDEEDPEELEDPERHGAGPTSPG
jgi:hypothetical protein